MTIVERLQIQRNQGAIREDVAVSQIVSEDNLADPFTKGLSQKIFDQHGSSLVGDCKERRL